MVLKSKVQELHPSQNKQRVQKKASLILIAILVVAFVVRLYRLTTPLADWHSWRQSDTASVTREYVKHGIDLLHPRYQDLSSIPSGQENPEGYRMVEFPIVNAATASLYNLTQPLHHAPIHVFSRFISTLFSLGSLIFLYKLVKLLENQQTALLTTLIFAFLPYNVFYSRTILPEVSLVFFLLGSLYFTSQYFLSNNHSLKNKDYWLGVVFGAFALLLKPYAILFYLPLLYLGYNCCGVKLIKNISSYLYLLLLLLPLLLWRWWISQFPEGIPAFTWLLNGNGIRFKGAWFRWLFAERLGKLILGYWGLIPFALGFLQKSKNYFFHVWALAGVVYFALFATGNVQHDYYQIVLIPIISVLVAKGIVFLLEAPKKYDFPVITSRSLLLTSMLFALAFSWFEVRGYYNINNPAIVKAGKVVDQVTPPDALVIAPYQGDTAFLYQTNRRGWPIGGAIEDKIKMGADYYVSTALDTETQDLKAKCQVLTETEKFVLINLNTCEF